MNNIEANLKYSELLSNLANEINLESFEPKSSSFCVLMKETYDLIAEAVYKEPNEYTAEIGYGLIKCIVSDAADFYDSYSIILENSNASIKLLHKLVNPAAVSPNKDQFINNCTCGALTWVLFHELAHITQGHLFLDKNQSEHDKLSINELYTFDNNINPNLSHAKELAADYQASRMCVAEVWRHHFSDNSQGSEESPAEKVNRRFLENCTNNLHEMCIGVTILLYRFYGCANEIDITLPKGSHPHPIIRLELIICIIMEMMDLLSTTIEDDNKREEIRMGILSACWTASSFIIRKINPNQDITLEYLPQPILERKNSIQYFSKIIEIWDTIRPQIEQKGILVKQEYLMSFNDVIRSRIFDSVST